MRGFVSETLIYGAGRTGEILAALGITPNKRGAHIHCPFPAHADRNPSWRWDDREGRYYCTCGGGDILDLVIQMGRASSPYDAAGYVRRVLGLPGGDARAETPAERAERRQQIEAARIENERRQAAADAAYDAETARRLAFAANLYAGSQPPDPLIRRYLDSRGIRCVPDLARLVDYRGLPAMCLPFGLPTEPAPGRLAIRPTQIAGVHLTFLLPDGSGKARDKRGRSKIMIGRGHDMPLVLAPVNDGGGLVIAEGIEDALTAHQLTGLGAWAAGAAVRLPGIARHVPRYVECVTLIEDDNPAGRDGCRSLAKLLDARGIDVLVERSEVRHAA